MSSFWRQAWQAWQSGGLGAMACIEGLPDTASRAAFPGRTRVSGGSRNNCGSRLKETYPGSGPWGRDPGLEAVCFAPVTAAWLVGSWACLSPLEEKRAGFHVERGPSLRRQGARGMIYSRPVRHSRPGSPTNLLPWGTTRRCCGYGEIGDWMPGPGVSP